jgi:hypothetical protein
VLIRRKKRSKREKRVIDKNKEKKALFWSVTGIAASSFTLDLIQPFPDKAVGTIPLFPHNTRR